ncbi:hypothetical protein L1049_013749 [Liquidambar formosana]|uniref:FAS1 domain-containing protein n=1 Tax=Liquidambar formosana TaxID=63359 RepID=A0AAP0RL79_LIQFO
MRNQLFFYTLLSLFLFLFHSTTTSAQSPAQAPAAPAPAATAPAVPAPAVPAPAAPTLAQPPAPKVPRTTGPTDITKILDKAGNFKILIRLLKTTEVGGRINTLLNKTNIGLTIFAPTDNAFSSLKSGSLNSLTDQQQVQMMLFHILPTYLPTSQFQTVSNPLRTQAGDTSKYQFPLNVTTAGNQVNVSTGVVNATVDDTIYSDNRLAVYQVDKVLLPMSIFGPKPPASAPALAPLRSQPTDEDSVADIAPTVVDTKSGAISTHQGWNHGVNWSCCDCCIFFVTRNFMIAPSECDGVGVHFSSGV